jgi:hypothetical protein
MQLAASIMTMTDICNPLMLITPRLCLPACIWFEDLRSIRVACRLSESGSREALRRHENLQRWITWIGLEFWDRIWRLNTGEDDAVELKIIYPQDQVPVDAWSIA